MTKKKALVSGSIFGLLVCVFYIFQHGIEGIFYGMSIFYVVQHGIEGIVCGMVSGLLFAAFMYLLYNSSWFQRKTAIMANNGPVLYTGGANHFLNGEAVGGKLYLLRDKLWFRSHNLNIQNHELQLDVHHIKAINLYNIAGIIPTGIQVALDNGKTEKFVVNNRKAWINEIKKVKEAV
jgi:hypothetical protein